MISLNPLASKYLSIDIQIIVSTKSLFLFFLTFWLYSLGIRQELPREKDVLSKTHVQFSQNLLISSVIDISVIQTDFSHENTFLLKIFHSF